MMTLVWFVFMFNNYVGLAITYTLKRYTDDPQVINFISSIGGFVGLFFGPIISFLSDRIWTRMGRRKPFILFSWACAGLTLALIPLIPLLTPRLNGVLAVIGFLPIQELTILSAILIARAILGIGMGPLEPLSMELVPPEQRGKFFAMRGVMGNLGSLLMYQMLWPTFDFLLPILKIPVITGITTSGITLELTGEQVIYTLSSLLYLIMGFYLMFCVRETKNEAAANQQWRDIKIGVFVRQFLKNVFGDRRWYPMYLIMIVPNITALVWGSLQNIMLTDQFLYSKPDLGLLGWPQMILVMVVVTPFAGWYSDKKPQIKSLMMAVLGIVGTLCLGTVIWIYKFELKIDPTMLPNMKMCFLLCTLVTVSIICYFVMIVEVVLKFVNRDDMRVWVSTVAVIKDVLFTIFVYAMIRASGESGIPPITLWMLIGQTSAVSGGFLAIVVGPMLYEFIPINKLGTVAAGAGLLGGIVTFGFANVGASWIKFYTNHIGSAPAHVPWDYTSIYVLQLLLLPLVIAVKVYFLYGVVKGRILPYGRNRIEVD